MSGAPEALCGVGGEAPLVLRRAWPRDGEHLLCEYVAPGGEAVAGQWFADRARLRAVAAETAGDVEVLERAGLVLHHGGADRRLAPLRPLLAAPGASLVAHRPEQRAIVRRARAGRTSYTKVVRPGRTGRLARGAGIVAGAGRGALRVPTQLARDDRRGVIVCEELVGRSLHALGDHPAADEAWERAGLGVARLHRLEANGVPAHRAGDEVALVERWLARAAAFGLLPHVDAARSLETLLDGPPGPWGLLHRDLHDKQLIHRPGAPIGVLDLDTLAVGERALDLANLLVHVELRGRQGRLDSGAADAARGRLMDAYDPDPGTRRRLDAYAAAARLRLAAVYAFRPAWRRLARELLDDTCAGAIAPCPA